MIKLTNEKALQKAKEILGEKYDYSLFNYKGYEDYVTLICPIHGEFKIKYTSIVQFGRGCPMCSSRQWSLDEWIKKANEVHNNKYDYSKVTEINYKTKVCIICPEHGEFWQLPNNHIQGQGCPKCYQKYRKNKIFSSGYKMTTEEFIKKAREVHGDKYDYSKVEYINAHTKVCIICPIHGEFWQAPNSHLKGIGCSACGKRKKITTEEFIKRAREIHGDKYDYSKVDYINNRTKVCIICPIHGEFWQNPSKHLDRKQGCPMCAHRKKSKEEMKNDIDNVQKVKEFLKNKQEALQANFIEKSNIIHNFKYDYSKVKYIDLFTKVCVICPEHGEFWVAPNNHLNYKTGCPQCNQSLIEYSVQKLLLNNNVQFNQYHREDWLHGKSLDFYISQYNIGIECQGEQHFQPVDFGGEGLDNAKLLLESQIERDLKKIELCKEHGITLLHYATCEVPKDFNLYEVITSEEELINKIKENIK